MRQALTCIPFRYFYKIRFSERGDAFIAIAIPPLFVAANFMAGDRLFGRPFVKKVNESRDSVREGLPIFIVTRGILPWPDISLFRP
jgi:hypothetical protein